MASFADRFRQNFEEEVGKTDFTDRSRNRRSNPNIQPETPTERPSNPRRRTLSGRHNPNMHSLDERGASNVELTEADIEDLQRDASLVDGPQGLRRQVTSHGGRRQVRQFDNGGVAVVGSETGNFNKGGTVNTVSSEAFTNPVPARFRAFDQGRFGEREFADRQREFNRKATRDAAIESDLEFRRNLRERRLLDDANLNLSGDMTLGELASRAARRRSARATLSQREANQAELAQTQAELQQQADLEQFKEEGRNRRAGLKARTGAEKADREARQQNRENLIGSLERLFTNEEGDVNQRFVQDTFGFAEASNLDTQNLDEADINKLADFNSLRNNLINSSNRGVVPENLSELEEAIGSIDKEVLNQIGSLIPGPPGAILRFLDSTDVRITNKDGKQIEQINLGDLAATPRARRALFEIIQRKVAEGKEPSVARFF